MHSEVYELIWFRLGWWEILLCCTFWYLSNWPWIKVTGMRESKNFWANHLTKFLIDLNRIWYTVETYWYDEPHTHSMAFSIQGRESYVYRILWRKLYHWLVFNHLRTHFFQTWYDDRNHWALHFDISWDDLIFIQGHSCTQKITNFSVYFFCKFRYRFWWNSVCYHNLLVCWSSC